MACTCPAVFRIDPAGTDAAVRCAAEQCGEFQIGGAMTVRGPSGLLQRPCHYVRGQVYDLEFAKCQCVPKRCPRDGPCLTLQRGVCRCRAKIGSSERAARLRPRHVRDATRLWCRRGTARTRPTRALLPDHPNTRAHCTLASRRIRHCGRKRREPSLRRAASSPHPRAHRG